MLKDAYAQVYLAQGDFAKAETSLNEAIALFQQMHSFRLGEAILWEAKSHLALRHFPETRASLAATNAIFTRQQQPHHAAAKLVAGHPSSPNPATPRRH